MENMIKPPPNSESYFNHKHSFSIVLAVIDADYKFIYIDVGCNGRVADGGVLKNSTLNTALEKAPSISHSLNHFKMNQSLYNTRLWPMMHFH